MKFLIVGILGLLACDLLAAVALARAICAATFDPSDIGRPDLADPSAAGPLSSRVCDVTFPPLNSARAPARAAFSIRRSQQSQDGAVGREIPWQKPATGFHAPCR
jgi:hypothetical protein